MRDSQALVRDIFELTGEKVDGNDPIVIAILFFGRRLQQADQDHRKAVADLLAQVQQQWLHQFDTQLARLTDAALQARAQGQLPVVASAVSDKIPPRTRAMWPVIVALLAGTLFGVAICQTLLRLPEADLRALRLGKAAIAAATPGCRPWSVPTQK